MTHPLLATAFRPFFLLGAALVVLLLPAWLLTLSGRIAPDLAFPAVIWHAHEMIWGFTVAIVAGFLLTAARNWTGRETARGPALLALVGLWIAGRLAATFGGGLPVAVPIAVDVAFLLGFAVALGRPLLAAQSTRNLGFPALVLVLAGADVAVHLGAAGATARLVALDAIALMIAVVGGRVVPMFTRNAIPGSGAHRNLRLDAFALGSLVVLLAADAFGAGADAVGAAAAPVAAVAGVANLVRMKPWGTLSTLRSPILWVLHLGYAWLGAGLVLRALAAYTPAIPPTSATHALTVGAIGTLTLGMMSRVALGHTGRPLRVGVPIVVAYVLVTVAVVLRVGAPWLGASPLVAWTVSGVAFAAAFAIFLAVYTPILVSPRADGRPG